MQIQNLISCLKAAALDGYNVKISAGVWLESGERILEDCAEYPDKPDVIGNEVYLVTDDGCVEVFDEEGVESILIDSLNAVGKIEIAYE